MHICFLREFCKDNYSIPAQFLSGYNPRVFSIKDTPEKTDIIGVTVFNELSLPHIATIKKKYPNNKIIAGGIGVFFLYRHLLIKNLVDYVYFGEAYDFNENHIIDKNMIGQTIPINRFVPYKKLPIIKTGKMGYYLLCETGCPFKCEFCLVSHANNYSKIDNEDFVNRIRFIDSKVKGNQITLVTNEGIIKSENYENIKNCNNNCYVAQSTTLKYFLKNKNSFTEQQIVRFGIELPTESDRKHHLPPIKQITDDEIKEMFAVNYKKRGGNIIQLFFIWNYLNVPIENYRNIADYAKYPRKSLLRIQYTTHNISPYTPQQPHVLNHIQQLINTPDFEHEKKYISHLSKTRIFPPQKNINILPLYIKRYGSGYEKYRMPSAKDNIADYYSEILKNNPELEKTIENTTKIMKIENDLIYTI